MIEVTVRPKPIDPKTKKFKVNEGLTVAQIVEMAEVRNVDPILSVLLNEQFLPRRMWPYLRPKNGTRLFISPVYGMGGGEAGGAPAGGAGGKSAAFSIIGMLAGSIPGIGPFGQLAIGIGLAVGAALLSKKPKQQRSKNDSPGQQPHAGFSANTLGAYDPIPFVLGRMRVSPPLLTDAWVEFFEKHIRIRGVVGIVGRYQIEDIRSNGMPIDDADLINYESFDGNGTADFYLLDHVGWTDQVGIVLSKHDVFEDEGGAGVLTSILRDEDSVPKWYSLLTKDSPDEIIFNIQSSGVTNPTVAPTNVSRLYVHYRIRMRRKGETSWRNLPELTYRTKPGYHQRKVRIKWYGTPTLGDEVTYQDSSNSDVAWSVYSDKGVTAAGQTAWTADSYFFEGLLASPGNQSGHTWGRAIEGSYTAGEEPLPATTPDGQDFVVWLHVNNWPQGHYEIQIKRSAITGGASGTYGSNPAQGGWNWETAAFSTKVDPFSFLVDTEEGPKIAPEQFETVDEITLHSVTYKWFESALQRPDTLGIAFELTDTQIDHLTALVTSYMETPEGSGTSGWANTIATRNPAAAWRKVLSDSNINSDPLHPGLLPDDFFIEWYDYCTDNNLNCDCIIEDGVVDDILPIIARAGDAIVSLSPRAWKVWIDRDRSNDSAEIIFSPRNVRNFNLERSFEEVPHAIRATYLDEDDDHTQKEIIVIDDPYTEETIEKIQAVDFKGITSRTLVERSALRQLRKGRLRRNVYSWETNLIGLNLEPGMLVGISHDVLIGAYGWGCIRIVHYDTSGLVAAIELDANINLPGDILDVYNIVDVYELEDILESPGLVAITLRDGSGTVEAFTRSSGKTALIEFAEPISDTAGMILEQCFVAVGQYQSSHKRVLIQSVTPGPDLTMKVTAIDEANEIFAE